MADEPLSFERAMEALEACVRRLESGDLPLDQALDVFEEGVRLQQRCQALLDGAEQRIIELTESSAQDG